jgi:sigma54-dependent transcription regulator
MAEIEKKQFVYPYRTYHGEETSPNIVFDANLQEFSQRVAIICALGNGGKLPLAQAYKEIKTLWKQLKTSKQNMLAQLNSEESAWRQAPASLLASIFLILLLPEVNHFVTLMQAGKQLLICGKIEQNDAKGEADNVESILSKWTIIKFSLCAMTLTNDVP